MAKHSITDAYLTIKQTVAYTGLAESSVRTMIKFGILPAVHEGCYWLPKEAVEQYMQTRRGRVGRPRKTGECSAAESAPAAERTEAAL